MVVVVVVSGGLVVLGGLLVVVLLLLLLLGGGLPWESVSGGGSVQLGCCVCLCSVDVVQLDCSFFSGCGSARLLYLSLFTGCDSAGPLYLCSVDVIHLGCCICLCSVDVVQFTSTAVSVFVQWRLFSWALSSWALSACVAFPWETAAVTEIRHTQLIHSVLILIH